MKTSLRIALFIGFTTVSGSALAAPVRQIDLARGCKAYRLENRAWVPADSATVDGVALERNQVIKNEKFFVFRTADGTFGVNIRCVKMPTASAAAAPAAAARPAPVGRRRAAARPGNRFVRGGTEAPWTATFSLGYNLAPSGTITTSFGGGTPTEQTAEFKSSIAFMAEGAYRFTPNLRAGVEIGLSQLSQGATGNETSFFLLRPDFVFRLGQATELYFGPILGLIFFSQNAETQTDAATGEVLTLKQQSATATMLGLQVGADYALSKQFDVGGFLRYSKPGEITLTGTSSTRGAIETKLSTSYITIAGRFVIHF